jgi:antitoxin CptB
MVSEDPQTRLRRLLYRARHRGTKEMDWLLGRYAEAKLAGMASEEVDRFEALCALPDPDVQDWILAGGAVVEPRYEALVADLRRFHGLG